MVAGIQLKEQIREAGQDRSFTELLPWLLLIDPQTVLCKDGSLLALFEYHPLDPEGRDVSSIDHDAQAMEQAFVTIQRDDVNLWFLALRRVDREYPEGRFTNPTAERIDTLYREMYQSKTHYAHRYYQGFLFSPSRRSGKIVDTFLYHQSRGNSIGKAMAMAVKESLGFQAHAIAESDRLVQQRKEMEELLGSFQSSAPVTLHRLEGKALLGALNELSSPSIDPHPVRLDDDEYLDGRLGEDGLAIFQDHLRFEGAKKNRYAAAITIKNTKESYPEETTPGFLDTIYQADAEWTMSLVMRMVSRDKARQVVKEFARHHRNMRKGMWTMTKEGITGIQSDNVNTDADIHAQDASEALGDLGRNPSAAYANMTVMVYGDNREQLERSVSQVTDAIHAAQCITMRERLHLLSAWAGTLPGQWAIPVRWSFLTGAPLADMAPLRGIYEGHRENAYFTKQRGSPHAALSVMETAERTSYFFNFHDRDLGHAIFIGPSRSGKSAMVNFLLSQWHRYPSSRVIIFDKDKSCWIPTLLHGGDYLGFSERGGLALNPMSQLRTDKDWDWCAGWMDQILSARDGPLNAAETNEMRAALERMKAVPASMRRLNLLNDQFFGEHATRLKERLSPWIDKGIWSRYFNHETDRLSLSNIVAIAMDDILAQPDPARAFMDYAFWRIENMLDGSPTVIYIEEAWFALENPYFARKLNEWLKRLAKFNVSVVMATQSAFDATNSTAFSAIADNVPTVIFLPNERAMVHQDLYRQSFQLSMQQISQLQEMTSKRDYYVMQSGTPKLIRTRFTPQILAYLRSDSAAKKLFQELMDSGYPDWKERYVELAQRLD